MGKSVSNQTETPMEVKTVSNSLPNMLFCAPMAEITTPALRGIIRRFSPGVTFYSEMLNAGAIACRAQHNEPLIRKTEHDEQLIYQIAGSKPAVMADACAVLSERDPYGIDINMGCSAPDIVRRGAGAALLKNYSLALEIVRACRRATRCLLSVKMRSGFDDHDHEGIINTAKAFEDAGIDLIALHPRHARLGFRRSADWKIVRTMKNSLRIPVVGNGDIITPDDAKKRLQETGCDGIMIGREAAKSPWIFKLCTDMMRGTPGTTPVDIFGTFIRVLEDLERFLPENLHKSRGHRFSFYFSKNVQFSHRLFTEVRHESTVEGMKHCVHNYFERNPHERYRYFTLNENLELSVSREDPGC